MEKVKTLLRVLEGEGTEIYVTHNEPSTNCEEVIVNKLSHYFVNRGVKRKNFAVINSARNKGTSSALLEVCFIDNQEDMEIYENNKQDIIKTIANGLIEGLGLNYNPDKPINEKYYQNGSTPEPVYSDYYLTQKIGELNPYEKCNLVDVYENRPIVRYEVDGTLDESGNFNEKIGFVEWLGGINE